MSSMQPSHFDLFADHEPEQQPRAEQIGEQSWVLRGFALPMIDQLLPALEGVLAAAPLRHMMTPAVSACQWAPAAAERWAGSPIAAVIATAPWIR